MPTAHTGMGLCSLRLKVNGKWLYGKELEDYIRKRDERDGANQLWGDWNGSN